MCGIHGVFNGNLDFIRHGLIAQAHRGQDAYGWFDGKSITIDKPWLQPTSTSTIAHTLHSIVGYVKQPIQSKGTIVANCEIYNYKALAKEYNIQTDNDTTVLLHALDQNDLSDQSILALLEKLNGVYAFAYWRDDTVILARDLIGEKPLFYSYQNGELYFASEQKTLIIFGIPFEQITDLHPRNIVTYNTTTKQISIIQRQFIALPALTTQSQEEIINQLNQRIEQAIAERFPACDFGILFSGGIDSFMLAYYAKKLGRTPKLYAAGTNELTHDVALAKEAATYLNLPLTKCTSTDENLVKEVVETIESSNVVKVGVALPFLLCAKKAKQDNIRVLLSGLGSEELFAGYERHKESTDINAECLSGLRKIYERDLYRDDVIMMSQTIELRLPFLDVELAKYALSIPAHLKIVNEHKKYILRLVAIKNNIPDKFAFEPKKAAQYGSGFDKLLEKLATKHGHKSKSGYLDTLTTKKNERLGILLSGGKDSLYAAYTMQRQNYPLVCAITIASTNQDSYMFHTPAINLTTLQCESMNIPQIIVQTTGEKEKELSDLEQALIQAKQEHNIQGIVSGALFSTYQRERIEKIAEKIGLKVFAPLWHKDQAIELTELLTHEFKIVFTKVAADGLDASWLNRIITQTDVHKLIALNKKNGLHVAGEGGEFESLVLHCPLFSKEIIINFSAITQDGLVHTLTVLDASLQ